MEGTVSAANLLNLMQYSVNSKLLTCYIGVGAIHKAMRDIVDGSYTNLFRPKLSAAAIASLLEPHPEVLQQVLGIADTAAYVRRLLTPAGFPALLDNLLTGQVSDDVRKELEKALA
jgi:glutamine synthetase adenylyltransferase